ncbi:MAG: diaminopimelate decarboxylase [Acidobacteria bacterium]|nr:diaminopimelate decarboxylase [Acidobacteriota bacterium]
MLLSIMVLAFMFGGESVTMDKPDPYHDATGRFSHDQLVSLVREHGSPLYVYDGDLINKKYDLFYGAYKKHFDDVQVLYAVKANTNMAIMSLLKQRGAGAECISGGEITTALKLGYEGKQILFTSSAKTTAELELAISQGVVINLDSMEDLAHAGEVAARLQKKAHISFRINPDVDPHTHKHIATGHKFSKFGILLEDDQIMHAYKLAHEHPWLEVWGLHSHIGSQITDWTPFQQNARVLVHFIARLKDELGIQLKFIDLGGGLGIPYHDGQKTASPEDVAQNVAEVLRPAFEKLGYMPSIWLEPGRFLVGDSGILLATVISVKDTPYTDFINVDTGFNHLVRPILYEAYHRIRVLNRKDDIRLFDVAGNICETGDILGHNRLLPTPKAGDMIAILDAGAYGYTMASMYNSFALPAEILVRGDQATLIRERKTLDDLLEGQIIPADLAPQ